MNLCHLKTTSSGFPSSTKCATSLELSCLKRIAILSNCTWLIKANPSWTIKTSFGDCRAVAHATSLLDWDNTHPYSPNAYKQLCNSKNEVFVLLAPQELALESLQVKSCILIMYSWLHKSVLDACCSLLMQSKRSARMCYILCFTCWQGLQGMASSADESSFPQMQTCLLYIGAWTLQVQVSALTSMTLLWLCKFDSSHNMQCIRRVGFHSVTKKT